MLRVIISTLLTTAHSTSVREDLAPSDSDLRDLSLLPLDKLLALKRALTHDDGVSPSTLVNDSLNNLNIQAQALRRYPGTMGAQPPRRGGGGPPPIWMEEVDVSWKGGGHGHGGGKGKGGLQGIFQGTVTVLAFLAFGGYLVCLIVNALKQKQAALEMTLLTTLEPATRRRRAAQLATADAAAEDMYTAMRTLAEAYAKYNQRCLHQNH